MDTLVFSTALGYMALARQGEQLAALTFGHSSRRRALDGLKRKIDMVPTESVFVESGEDRLADRLCEFASGTACEFDDVLVDTSYLTPFGRAVIQACRSIGWGETVTYGQLARQAGRPAAARAVGSVMARNRVPLIVPCHRVVPANGGLGGFSAPQGVSMKERLLKLEQQPTETSSFAAMVGG